MKIQILVFDGFDEIDVVGVFEPLRMAGQNVSFRSLYDQSIVEGAFGMKIIPEGKFEINEEIDMLIVPGGGWVSRSPRGAWGECNKGVVLQALKACSEKGIKFAAVCTGVMLLGSAGLLEGRSATTNHSAVDELKATGAVYIDARVVDDGDIITASGVSSSIDLGLYLIDYIFGASAAADISERLEFKRRGPIWKNGSFVSLDDV